MNKTPTQTLIEPPYLANGKRIFIAGKTGGGKSTWARYYIDQIKQHVIIIDPKNDFKNEAFTVDNIAGMDKHLRRERKISYVPKIGESDYKTLDSVVGHLHENYSNVCLVLDETYALHSGGRCGDGLTAWITRGRSLNQTLIACSQRPAWISQMLLSESEIVAAGRLRLMVDRKRLTESTGEDSFMSEVLQPYTFRFYDSQHDKTGLFRLKLDQ